MRSEHTRGYSAAAAFLLLALVQCAQLKYDANANCFNPVSSCFIPDKTKPTITNVVYTPALVGGNIGVPPQIDVTFSEPMRNADQISLYNFSGAGAAGPINITQINKISDTQYSIITGGTILNGPITLNMPGVTDLSGNVVNALPMSVSFTGLVNITITFSPAITGSTLYVSNQGGSLNNAVFTWYHDEANGADYAVELTAIPCSSYTANVTGTGVSGTGIAKTPTTTTTTISYTQFPAASQTLRVCARNIADNKTGEGVLSIIRDDVSPTTNTSLAGGTFTSTQTVTLTCSDGNVAKVAYTTDGSAPSFNRTTGAITNGNLYSGVWTTPDHASTTLKYLCLDLAGNVEGAVNTQVYNVESTTPSAPLVSGVETGSVSGSVAGTIHNSNITPTFGPPPANVTYTAQLGPHNGTLSAFTSGTTISADGAYDLVVTATSTINASQTATTTISNFMVDKLPPSIASSVPANNATAPMFGCNAPAINTITVTFSEPMQGADVAGNYSLTGSGVGSNTISSASLAGSPANTYSLYICSGTDITSGSVTITLNGNIKDLAGNTLSGGNTIYYPAVDNVAPVIASMTPANQSSGAATSTTIALTFNKAMNVTTVTGNTINTACSGNYGVNVTNDASDTCVQMSGAPSVSGGNTIFTFTPVSLTGAATYSVYASNAKDVAGNRVTATIWPRFSTTGMTVNAGAGVVNFTSTGLYWKQCPEPSGISGGNCTGGGGSYQYCNIGDNSCNGGTNTGTLSSGPAGYAYAICNAYNTNPPGGLGGRTGWRVPTITELSNFWNQFYINQSLFQNGMNSSNFYWSANSLTANAADTYYFYYPGNHEYGGGLKSIDYGLIRCVSN